MNDIERVEKINKILEELRKMYLEEENILDIRQQEIAEKDKELGYLKREIGDNSLKTPIVKKQIELEFEKLSWVLEYKKGEIEKEKDPKKKDLLQRSIKSIESTIFKSQEKYKEIKNEDVVELQKFLHKLKQYFYNQSEKGKNCKKEYKQSEKGKAKQKQYNQSEERKAYKKRYRQSEKGKAYQKEYNQSEKARAYQKRYYQLKKEQRELEKADEKKLNSIDKELALTKIAHSLETSDNINNETSHQIRKAATSCTITQILYNDDKEEGKSILKQNGTTENLDLQSTSKQTYHHSAQRRQADRLTEVIKEPHFKKRWLLNSEPSTSRDGLSSSNLRETLKRREETMRADSPVSKKTKYMSLSN